MRCAASSWSAAASQTGKPRFQLPGFYDLVQFVGQRPALADDRAPHFNPLARSVALEIASIWNFRVRQFRDKFWRRADEDGAVQVRRRGLTSTQAFVEPSRHDTIEEMRVKSQPACIALRYVEMVIDDATITIGAG